LTTNYTFVAMLARHEFVFTGISRSVAAVLAF
jgi:hypothetical protein